MTWPRRVLLAMVMALMMLLPATRVALARAPLAAIVVDARTGAVLFARNADAIRYPASISKVMTLYLLFREIRAGRMTLNTRLKVSRRAAAKDPSKLWLKPGQTIRVDQAIRALTVKSANDVAAVVAENIAGSEAAFARRMTLMARALGMTRTTFRNASGLPTPPNVTTARDLATLSLRLMRDFPRFYKRYFGLKTFRWRGHAIRNHNGLLWRVAGMDGIKTGYTRAAGSNLAASVRRNGRRIVAVVLSAPSSRFRNAYMARLIEQSFRRYRLVRGTRIASLAGTPPGWNPARAQRILARLQAISRPRGNFHASQRRVASAARARGAASKPRVRTAELVVIPARGQSRKLARLAVLAAKLPPAQPARPARSSRPARSVPAALRQASAPAPRPRPASKPRAVSKVRPVPTGNNAKKPLAKAPASRAAVIPQARPRPARPAAGKVEIFPTTAPDAGQRARQTPSEGHGKAADTTRDEAGMLAARVHVEAPSVSADKPSARQPSTPPAQSSPAATDTPAASTQPREAIAGNVGISTATTTIAEADVPALRMEQAEAPDGSVKGNSDSIVIGKTTMPQQPAPDAPAAHSPARAAARDGKPTRNEPQEATAPADKRKHKQETAVNGATASPANRRHAQPAATRAAAARPAASQPAASQPVASQSGATGEILLPSPRRAHELMRTHWLIQIGAFPSLDGAKEYLRKARKLSRNVRGRQPVVIRVRKGGSVFYRARYAGLSRRQAVRACHELKRRGLSCLPMAPGAG